MTPEKQRIAIAEACGWTVECVKHFKVLYPPGSKHYGFCCGLQLTDNEVWECGINGDENGNYCFPNYLNDLNAMHEAEKVLTGKQWGEYCKWVDALSRKAARIANWRDINPSYVIDAHQIHSDADVKTEAFLRTLGKWEEA